MAHEIQRLVGEDDSYGRAKAAALAHLNRGFRLGASDALAGSIRCVPRTTIDIDASVLRELKRRQRREKTTLGQLVSELLARALSEENVATELQPLQWPSQDLRPRIDLEDKDAVWRILDGGGTG